MLLLHHIIPSNIYTSFYEFHIYELRDNQKPANNIYKNQLILDELIN